jgi:hypothetical protein
MHHLLAPPRSSLPTFKLGMLVLAFFLLQSRPARAENSVSYKFADYRESDDRMSVESHYGLIEQDLGATMHLKLLGVLDSISGATPSGQPPATPGGPVPLADVSDYRKAWSADFSRQFSRINASIGFANSRENDYVSDGWSLNTLTDFNQKNTTLLVGIAGTNDDIRVFFQSDWVRKRTNDVIIGVTQLLNPLTSVTFNLSYGRSTGYHADPYRVILQRVEVAPGVFLPLTFGENRPDEREKWTAFASINRSFPAAHGAAELSYRLFDDTFGTTAHTIEVAWFQKLGEHVTLRPGFRFYDQSAADFYRIDLTETDIVPPERPNPAGPFYSADYRVSAFRSYTYGLKGIWTINANWQVDAAVERYEMDGQDSITSPSVYPRAMMVNLGLRFAW